MAKIVEIAKSVKKVAQDDPRRVIHSIKVGLAVTLVSLFYYSQPLYNGFGASALWAILTVIVVFEYTVGATLGKGLNRTIATLVAGALGVGAHSLASHFGKIGEPVLIGIFVFLQASASTFMRFFPKIKARYDYGFLIFILTFSFISISGFRVDEIIELARQRSATIMIGVFGSLFISVFIFPVWAGEDLHNMVANNMDKLGNSLEAFGIAYFKVQDDDATKTDTSVSQTYKSVLNTKNVEETLANFARWEPRHGQFRYRHPWNRYLKLGALSRECAYKLDALSTHLNPDIKAQPTFRDDIRDECNIMSSEASKVLKELAIALKTMTQPSSCKAHVAKAKAGVKSLKDLLESSTLWDDSDLLQVIPSATVSSILIDIVNCTEKMVECTSELASLAHFKASKLTKPQSLPKNIDRVLEKLESIKIRGVNPDQNSNSNSNSNNARIADCSHIVITIDAGE